LILNREETDVIIEGKTVRVYQLFDNSYDGYLPVVGMDTTDYRFYGIIYRDDQAYLGDQVYFWQNQNIPIQE
jgi:hypothetical protein